MENLQINAREQSPEGKHMGALQKVSGVVFAPTEVMKNLAEKPGLLLPLILMVLAPVLLLVTRYGAYLEWFRQTIEEAAVKKGQQLTPEMVEAQLKFGGIFGAVGIPIGSVVGWLVGTAILFAVVKAFKGEGTFKHYLSVTAYAGVLMVLYYLIMGAVSVFTGVLDFNAPVTAIASLLPDDWKGTFIHGLLTPLDVFTVWEYVVIAIGVVQVSKLKKNKVYGIVGGIFAALMLYGGIGQLIGGMFTK